MKKLLSVILAVAMLVSLCAVSVNADEETNVALNKEVTATNNGAGEINVTLGFWSYEYLTDGLVPVFGDTNDPNQDRLGWYAGVPASDPERTADMDIEIDLDGVFDITKIVLQPQTFLLGSNFISDYTISVSTDENNWKEVVSEKDVAGVYEAKVYSCSETAAYVLLHVTKLSATADANYFYGGLAEIEVYGTAHKEDETPVVTDEPADGAVLHGASFDSFYVNDVLNFGGDDGSASAVLDAHDRKVDGSDGSVQTLRFRGWIGFESELDTFGYMINGKFTAGNFTVEPESAVVADSNGGRYAKRFDITVPVADLTGSNEIKAAVKLANGQVVAIDENVKANGAGTTPNTTVTYIGVAPSDEPAPQTGDAAIAMFAVVLVAAMGAAVVFSKKRAF